MLKWLHDDVDAAEDIRRENNSGRSPYNCAARFKHFEACKWLILNGALNDADEGKHVTYENVLKDTRPDVLDDDSDSDDEESDEEVAAADRAEQLKELFATKMIRWANGEVERNRTFFDVVVRGVCCTGHVGGATGSALASKSLSSSSSSEEVVVEAEPAKRRQRAPRTYSASASSSSSSSSSSLTPDTVLAPITMLGSLGSDTTRGFLQRIADFLDVHRGRRLRNLREFATHLEAAKEARRIEVQVST